MVSQSAAPAAAALVRTAPAGQAAGMPLAPVAGVTLPAARSLLPSQSVLPVLPAYSALPVPSASPRAAAAAFAAPAPAVASPVAAAAALGGAGEARRPAAASAKAAFEALRAGAAAVAKPATPAGALREVFDASAAFEKAGIEPAVDASDVKSVYGGFLRRLGFHSYGADIAQAMAARRPVEHQAQTFETAARRLAVLDASREVAVTVMAGLERQGYGPAALERAVDLAARLIELRPLEAPSRLPFSMRGAKRPERLRWLLAVTNDKASLQAGRVLSDVAGAAFTPEELGSGRRPELEALLGRVQVILASMYADVEYGSGRFAGRALVMSLARWAKVNGRPDVEAALATALARRGFKLSDYIGNRFELADRFGNYDVIELRSGDILGTRRRSRRSSEIAIGAVPHPSRWWRAWREGLFGSILGPWMKPLEKYAPQEPGQPWRNRLRAKAHEWRKRVANTPHFLKGYSHAAIADVREADGIFNVLVWENEVDASEGGIRPVSFWDQFLVKDYHARFGYARWDPEKVWDAFHEQARRRGYEEHPHTLGRGAWRSVLSREEYERLLSIPRERAGDLVEILHARSLRLIEALMTGFGIGYGYGLADSLLRMVCTSTIWHAYRVGSQFEMQSKPDMFHPLTYVLKWLGSANTAGLDIAARVIWPASFFVDEKRAFHHAVELAGREGGRRAEDNDTLQTYAERDPGITERLRGLLAVEGEDPFSFKDGTLEAALTRQLLARRWRRRDPSSGRSGLSLPRGYVRDAEILYDR